MMEHWRSTAARETVRALATLSPAAPSGWTSLWRGSLGDGWRIGRARQSAARPALGPSWGRRLASRCSEPPHVPAGPRPGSRAPSAARLARREVECRVRVGRILHGGERWRDSTAHGRRGRGRHQAARSAIASEAGRAGSPEPSAPVQPAVLYVSIHAAQGRVGVNGPARPACGRSAIADRGGAAPNGPLRCAATLRQSRPVSRRVHSPAPQSPSDPAECRAHRRLALLWGSSRPARVSGGTAIVGIEDPHDGSCRRSMPMPCVAPRMIAEARGGRRARRRASGEGPPAVRRRAREEAHPDGRMARARPRQGRSRHWSPKPGVPVEREAPIGQVGEPTVRKRSSTIIILL